MSSVAQNTAVQLLTNTRRQDHISPALASLHWLSVNFRIDFQILPLKLFMVQLTVILLNCCSPVSRAQPQILGQASAVLAQD